MHNDPLNAAATGVSPETVDAAARGALKASPAGAVMFVNYVLAIPVEKWVSLAVLVFTVLQIVALVRREFFQKPTKSRRSK